MRNWTWWKLYVKVQPMLSVARAEDEMKEKEEELKKAMEDAEANAKRKAELEETLTNVMGEKDKLFTELQTTSEILTETEEDLAIAQAAKVCYSMIMIITTEITLTKGPYSFCYDLFCTNDRELENWTLFLNP